MEGEHHRSLTPPVYFRVALVVVVIVAIAVPVGSFSSLFLKVTGIVLIVTGTWLNIRSAGQFARAGTPIRPGSWGGSLVTDGVFSFSRNPMYLGMAVVLLGAALALGSAAAVVVPVAFVWILDRRFVAAEELILKDEFGSAYQEYQARVRRWL